MMNTNIDNLIQKHGKRTKPNDQVYQQARNNVHAHWLAASAKHKVQKHRVFLFKIAASLFVVLSLGIGLVTQYPVEIETPVATLAYTHGKVEISKDQKSWQLLQSGQKLSNGVWIKSSVSGLASLTLNDNSELRMNASTLIHINKPAEIELLHGQIYHDADFSDHSLDFNLKTKFANIQHIGTRYAVKVNKNLQVSVRNGQVLVNHNHQDEKINGQQQLTLKTDGSSQKSQLSAYDNSWQWTQLAAQPFNLKNKSLNQFITWFAHEHGYQVDWNGQKINTKTVKLNGSINNMSQNDLVKTVFLSTQYKYQISDGILHISK